MRYMQHLICSAATFVLSFFFMWLYGHIVFTYEGIDTVRELCSYLGIYGVEDVLDFYMFIVLFVSFILASLVVWLAARFIHRKLSKVE